MVSLSIIAISDPVCPHCYTGALHLQRAISLYRKTVPLARNDTITIRFHAHQLDPHAKKQPLLEKMASKFGADRVPEISAKLREMGLRGGLRYDFSSIIGNTRDAHRLHVLARSHNLEMEVAVEVMGMYFERGGDITSLDDLSRAAERAGMDADKVKTWLEGEDGGEEVDDEVVEARRMGISGVPRYVINGKYVVDGAQDVSVFLEQFVMAREEALQTGE